MLHLLPDRPSFFQTEFLALQIFKKIVRMFPHVGEIVV